MKSSVGLCTPRYLIRDTFNWPYGNPNRHAMEINLPMLHALSNSARFIFFFSGWLHAKKEEKWLPAIMDPGKLMFIYTELTLVLVSGLEADTPKVSFSGSFMGTVT